MSWTWRTLRDHFVIATMSNQILQALRGRESLLTARALYAA
jgi:hypothetical protein